MQQQSAVRMALQDRPAVRIIPYDHVASFDFRKTRVGELREDVVNVGVEGVFVAVAIGYGFESEGDSLVQLASANDSSTLGSATLADIPPHALMDGFRLNPALSEVTFPRPQSANPNDPNGRQLDRDLDLQRANRLGVFQSVRNARDVSFLFNIVDSGSGRELQNLPVHNIAGLGKSNGERPFRMLARPLAFLPASSVRIQIEQQTHEVDGTLYIALHGYKILGASGVSEDLIRGLYQRAMRQFGTQLNTELAVTEVERGIVPSSQIVPFDYVGQLALTGQPGRLVETEINVNVEGGFVATSIGYSLRVDDRRVNLQLPNQDGPLPPDDDTNSSARVPVDLASIALSSFPSAVLAGGFRIKPEYRRIAFANGQLNSLPRATVDTLFEPLNLPERVSFRYAIEDTGTGRAWQNEAVHNIAGLGIADGDRPFRRLAWPMHFLPRSTIRLRIEELFGRGQLYVVFQGYKKLGVA